MKLYISLTKVPPEKNGIFSIAIPMQSHGNNYITYIIKFLSDFIKILKIQ